jgi:hypothetical protein
MAKVVIDAVTGVATEVPLSDADLAQRVIDIETAAAARMDSLRAERNARLTACDWTQLSDAPLSEAARNAWADYRQALRDLPDDTEDPANPDWPVAP